MLALLKKEEDHVVSAKEQLVNEVERLFSALRMGLGLLKLHYPDQFERLKSKWKGIFDDC